MKIVINPQVEEIAKIVYWKTLRQIGFEHMAYNVRNTEILIFYKIIPEYIYGIEIDVNRRIGTMYSITQNLGGIDWDSDMIYYVLPREIQLKINNIFGMEIKWVQTALA